MPANVNDDQQLGHRCLPVLQTVLTSSSRATPPDEPHSTLRMPFLHPHLRYLLVVNLSMQ